MSQSEEIRRHEEMWHNFLKLVWFSAAAIAIALGLMAIFLL